MANRAGAQDGGRNRPADSRVEARQKIGGLVPAGPDAVRVAEGLLAGLGLSQRAIEMPELFWALRSLLWSMAKSEPVVLVLDDLHWAEPALLELIEHLLDARGDGGVLLVCPTRPDLFEHHPDWADLRDRATQVGLGPLKTDESELLVDELLGSSEVPAELREAVTACARGNPLFVEEIVRLLVDRGSLESHAGRWVATEQIAVDELPPSIDALLASRLDCLDRGERGALEAAAVCGETFWSGAVAEMSPGEDAKELGAALESLVSRGLTTPERSSFPARWLSASRMAWFVTRLTTAPASGAAPSFTSDSRPGSARTPRSGRGSITRPPAFTSSARTAISPSWRRRTRMPGCSADGQASSSGSPAGPP